MRVFTEQASIKVQASTYEMVREWEDVGANLKSDGIIYLLHTFPPPIFISLPQNLACIRISIHQNFSLLVPS